MGSPPVSQQVFRTAHRPVQQGRPPTCTATGVVVTLPKLFETVTV
jgi:hypothetical protein